LQMKLGEGREDILDKIFEAVLPETVKLAKDVFGNFVIQRLLEKGSSQQKSTLASKMSSEIVDLACNKYACRVIQKTLSELPSGSEEQLAFASNIGKDDVVACIESMHGNHVIQACVSSIPAENLGFILDPVCDRADFVCKHAYGCRIMQRLIEKCQPHHIERMVGQLIPGQVAKLSSDKHGNYVIQCMLEHGQIIDKQRIIEVITKNIIESCKNKISSNVVEKCFEIVTSSKNAQDLYDQRKALVRTLIGEKGSSETPLQQIMNDRFGNYIVQNVIKHSRGMDPEDRDLLQQTLEDLQPKLEESATGKHIIATFTKEFRENP